jgi:hypothetical protein
MRDIQSGTDGNDRIWKRMERAAGSEKDEDEQAGTRSPHGIQAVVPRRK